MTALQPTDHGDARVAAIDVHAHYGVYQNHALPFNNGLMSADAARVIARARSAGVAVTVVSPLQALMPRGGCDPVGGNEEAHRAVAAEARELRQWVVIDPRRPETFEQAGRMLDTPWCVGIKMHPEEHLYHVAQDGRSIFEFAAERGAVILSHSGEANSLPVDLANLANDFPAARLILAHLGCGWDGDLTHQVRAIAASRHGNVFTDTSSAASLTPGLIEWAVGEVGADRILFGSDTPLYVTAMQRARIDAAEITDADRRLILRDNARRLLNLGDD